MAKVTKELLEKMFPDWEVSGEEGSFDLSSHSNAGENVVIPIMGDTLYDMASYVETIYNDFDPQDHAAQIYHAKHYGSADEQRFYAGAPGDLEDLIADAKEIDEMYYAVYQTLCKAYNEDLGDGDDSEEE